MTDAGVARFYVDEAGDLSMFSKRGDSLLGREGVSKTFMLGVLELKNPSEARLLLRQLRADLLNDPYFSGVPSMQPDARKTAMCFHAKDDLPEVRREVFKLIRNFDVKVHVVVRRKASLMEQARQQLIQHGQKLAGSTIYESLVKTVFQNLLHKAEENHIVFARRGKSNRQTALTQAIEYAQKSFESKWKKGVIKPVTVATAVPSDSPGLQIIDYYLWALQRLFDRDEDRFFNLLADRYSLIIDLDDRRNSKAGRWYSRRKNPLTLEKKCP